MLTVAGLDFARPALAAFFCASTLSLGLGACGGSEALRERTGHLRARQGAHGSARTSNPEPSFGTRWLAYSDLAHPDATGPATHYAVQITGEGIGRRMQLPGRGWWSADGKWLVMCSGSGESWSPNGKEAEQDGYLAVISFHGQAPSAPLKLADRCGVTRWAPTGARLVVRFNNGEWLVQDFDVAPGRARWFTLPESFHLFPGDVVESKLKAPAWFAFLSDHVDALGDHQSYALWNWSPDGGELLVSRFERGEVLPRFHLLRLGANPPTPEPLEVDDLIARGCQWAPAGRRLACHGVDERNTSSGLLAFDMTGRGASHGAVLADWSDLGFQWAGGDWIIAAKEAGSARALRTDRAAVFELFRQEGSGGVDVSHKHGIVAHTAGGKVHLVKLEASPGSDQVLPLPKSIFRRPIWSPDGRHLLVEQSRGGPSWSTHVIWLIVDAATGSAAARRIAIATEGQWVFAMFTPGSKWVVARFGADAPRGCLLISPCRPSNVTSSATAIHLATGASRPWNLDALAMAPDDSAFLELSKLGGAKRLMLRRVRHADWGEPELIGTYEGRVAAAWQP